MTPQDRKQRPLFSGVLAYFPDALLEVAYASFMATQQHHPDKPMHWDRTKSQDHKDCAARHLLDSGTLDDDGVMHTAKAAWRMLAALQLECEARKAAEKKVFK